MTFLWMDVRTYIRMQGRTDIRDRIY